MNKNKFLLITSMGVNNIGDIIFDLFIAWELSSATGKFMNAVYIIGTSLAFRAVLCFLMGSFVDKHSKKKIMIFSHVCSVVIIICFNLYWELIKQFIAIGILFVLLNDINNELFNRSYISMMADMFDENQYIKFQSYSNILRRIIGIGGAALAGTLIDSVSSHTVFMIDILTYLISLLLIQRIDYQEVGVEVVESNGICKNVISDIKYTIITILKSSYLLSFIILMFTLNLAYGYIPNILPLLKANIAHSATLLGVLKSSITIGEIVGFVLVSRLSKYVSATFKISMLSNIFVIMGIYLAQSTNLLVFFFVLYGLSDSLTQPLFGYTVANLDSANRGKLLGGIDAMIMLSPSIGIYVISAISAYNETVGGVVIAIIFLTGFLIVTFNKKMQHIVLAFEKD